MSEVLKKYLRRESRVNTTYIGDLCREALAEIERLEREVELLRSSVPAVALPVYALLAETLD